MSRTALLGTFVFVVAGLSGCATPARVVDSDRSKVVVAVPDNTNTWPFYYRDEAQRAAGELIQDPVLISSARVKVGEQMTNVQDTTRRDIGGQKDKPKFGEVVTSTNTTSVSDKYEYHLEFVSRSPSQFTPPGKPGMPPPIPGGSPLTPAGGIATPGFDTGSKPATSVPATTIPGPR
jgi:hypothetical protein